MKKIYSLFLLMGMLFCMFSAVTYAAGFQTMTDTSLSLYKTNEADKSVPYSEGINKIIIRIHKVSDATDELLVYKDQVILYKQQMSHDWSYRIYQLKNSGDGRFFYVINSNKENWLMGYDTVKNKWQVYASSADFYNSVQGNPWIRERNGDIILSFHDMGKENPTQEYRLIWDSRSNWFGYEDLGPHSN